MLTRQIGSILRGKATRLQVMPATVLGSTLGFIPGFFLPGDLGGGFAQAPGLILLLLCIVLIANANLAIFAMTTLLAKLLSWPLLSLSYWLGTFLIDGPLHAFRRQVRLGVDVNIGVVDVGCVRSDGHTFDYPVRHAFHKMAVFEYAGLTFLRVHDQVSRRFLNASRGLPLQRGGKVRPASTPQPRRLDRFDHVFGGRGQRPSKAPVTAIQDVVTNIQRV